MWGLKIALAHRILLLLWMAIIWVTVGQPLNIPIGLHVDPIAQLPALSPVEQATLGVWRRWDASHYLNLAQNGYRVNDPGPTVFGVLTPIGVKVFDTLLPGGVDIGGMAFATMAFWLTLVMLYRFCEVYYNDQTLARWATGLLAILPHAFFFAAPMSEAIYVALALGVFYTGARGQWLGAAIFGALATLARSQGALLAGVAFLLLLEESIWQQSLWRDRLFYIIKRGWVLALIPLALAAFLAFRQNQGLIALDEIYRTRSFIFFVNPLEGLRLNIAWAMMHPADALFNPDILALAVSIGLTIWAVFLPLHRRLPLLAYTLGFLLVFITKMNWAWGDTNQITYTQSFARYSLALFPLTVLVADKLRRTSRRIQTVVIGLSISGLLLFSGLFTLGGGSP